MKMHINLQLLILSCLFGVNSCQCPPQCLCLGGYVNCSYLTSLPLAFPVDTRTITFIDIDVEEIPAGLFENLLELEEILFSSGSIQTIKTDSFSNLMYLDKISLNDVKIGTITSGAFRNITDVGEIAIHFSTIDTIEKNAFADMFALDEIQVFSSSISEIESQAFNSIDELLRFQFSSNNVGVMEKFAFSNFTNLLELDISSNVFDELGCGSIESLLSYTEEIMFFQNSVTCSCELLWIKNNPGLSNHFMSNWCTVPGEDERISWNDVTSRAPGCKDSSVYECSLTSLEENTEDILNNDAWLGVNLYTTDVFNIDESETTINYANEIETTMPSYKPTEHLSVSESDIEITLNNKEHFIESTTNVKSSTSAKGNPSSTTTVESYSTSTTNKPPSKSSVTMKTTSKPQKEIDVDISTLDQSTIMLPVTPGHHVSTEQSVSVMDSSFSSINEESDHSSTFVPSPKFKSVDIELENNTPAKSDHDIVVTGASTISNTGNKNDRDSNNEHVQSVAYVTDYENSSHMSGISAFLTFVLLLTSFLFNV